MGKTEMEARRLLRDFDLETILENAGVTTEEALEYLIAMGAVKVEYLEDLVRSVDEEGT